MKFSYAAYILVVLQIEIFANSYGTIGLSRLSPMSYAFVDPTYRDSICEHIVSYRESERIPYIESYKEKTWGIFYKTKLRWNYKIEYRTVWRKEQKCCDGYAEVGFFRPIYCEPTCQPACGNGTCVKPNVCLCHTGYNQQGTDMASDFACVPVCTQTCVHGKCTAPKVCTCDPGYSLNADGFTCEPVCDLKCESGSYCSEPNHCACLPGYTDTRNLKRKIQILNMCDPICESKCVNGKCVAPNTCACDDGYELDPDNLFVCKPKCDHGCHYGTCVGPNMCACDHGYSLKNASVCEPICSEACVMGTCVAPEICKCFEGYGLLDKPNVCEPLCEKACFNGKCSEPNVCTCNEGFKLNRDESMKHICEPHCEMRCEPFGTCTAPNVCTCSEGFRLISEMKIHEIKHMKLFAGYSACGPICDVACTTNGVCISPGRCVCNVGYHKSFIDGVCEPTCNQDCVNGFCSAPDTCTCNDGYLPSDNSTDICKPYCKTPCVNGFCSAPDVCTCNSGYQSVNGTDPQQSTCKPICNPSCKNGDCVLPDVCDCHQGYRQSTNSTNMCEPICHEACEKNGICEAPHRCVCKGGYRMVNYDKENTPFGCDPICKVDCGNGTCTAPDFCTCFEGYGNAETGSCEPVCARCNNGTCVAPEVCECDDGFVHENSDQGIRESRFVTEIATSVNGSGCVPYCENCDNGECVAPEECRCHAGFVGIEGTCVEACMEGCGIHGECVDERRACECKYGWTGLHCDRAALCVSILNDEENRTKSLSISEEFHNFTITYVFVNNPACPECSNKVNNETLCYEMPINGTTKIACLMDTECLASSSQYKNEKEIIKGGVAGGFVILLIISVLITIYVRKRRSREMNLGAAYGRKTSMQGLVEQSD